MKRAKKKTEPVSPTFFLKVMNHWATPGIVGAVVGLSLLLLCAAPLGIALGVSAFFTGAIFSALRFFGSSSKTYKKPKEKPKETPKDKPKNKPKDKPKDKPRKRPISSSRLPQPTLQALTLPDFEFDTLENFLCLLYDVSPYMLKTMQVNAAIAPHSSLIDSVNEIKNNGVWGTALHADYLARLFGVHCDGVMVDAKTQLHGRAKFSTLEALPGGNWSFTGERESEYLDAVRLINHGNGHWTTLLGRRPASGEDDAREYLNNPGEENCFFYAFSLGLARAIFKNNSSTKSIKDSPLFLIWCDFDKNMKNLGVAHALFNLGESENPKQDSKLHKTWCSFQRSLRHIVAYYMTTAYLPYEGSLALTAYESIQTTEGSQAEKNKILNKLFDDSPLYREFNMLYNLNKKTRRNDLLTNIFIDLHPSNQSIGCDDRIKINI